MGRYAVAKCLKLKLSRNADFARIADGDHRVLRRRAYGGGVIQAVGQVFAVEPHVELVIPDFGVVGDKGISYGGCRDFPQTVAAGGIFADIPCAVVFGSDAGAPVAAQRVAEIISQI